MRCFLAGLVLLLTIPATAFAQARGEVESIGFGSLFRPNCHIPMLVRVQADKSGTYKLQVIQEDLDRDQQLFTETISLTGAEEGKGAEQRFWIYFIPQPTKEGLPDTSTGGSLRDLQQALKVYLCDEKGKHLVQLPITQTIQNLDSANSRRGIKLILAVSDGAGQPIWHDYEKAIGVMEDVNFVTVRPTDLPEDIRGYECIDAILWLNAVAPDPAKPAEEKRFKAIQEYVRSGGHLLVCQPGQREATASFFEMLPVTVTGIDSRTDTEPLKSWSKNPSLWSSLKGPFQVARAQAKSGSRVVEEIAWNADGTDKTPYLARSGFGLGAVTWVAQDLSDPTITSKTRNDAGWPYIWDKVFDWKNDTLIVDNSTPETQRQPYASSGIQDAGWSFLSGMELSSKSRALVSIAVVFFIAYWVVAGPGVYFFLLTRSRAQMSWFLFGLAAVAATVFTVLVVKLVVRGPPELAHVTLVRAARGEMPIELSRFGLYIPRDGAEEITVPDCAPNHVSFITAFAHHPSHGTADIDYPAQLPYVIPIREASSDEPVTITIPFRSTLKKLQVRRVGVLAGAIDGSATLKPDGTLKSLVGAATNGTGQKLKSVYFVYADSDDDHLLYLPSWQKGQTINLAKDFDISDKSVKFIVNPTLKNPTDKDGDPSQNVKIVGPMGLPGRTNGWSEYWFAEFRRGGLASGQQFNDSESGYLRSFPMMSLFGRLPPVKNPTGDQNKDRVEILRRGARYLDISPAVAAGKLVVLAQSDEPSPLPYELDVQGSKVEGKGTIFYQFVLPLNRPAEPPATQPTTPPSTQPGSQPATPQIGV